MQPRAREFMGMVTMEEPEISGPFWVISHIVIINFILTNNFSSIIKIIILLYCSSAGWILISDLIFVLIYQNKSLNEKHHSCSIPNTRKMLRSLSFSNSICKVILWYLSANFSSSFTSSFANPIRGFLMRHGGDFFNLSHNSSIYLALLYLVRRIEEIL